MKKRIAFFQDNLSAGGIQKSLFNLLRNLDYDRVDVTLFLFQEGCFFTGSLPECGERVLRNAFVTAVQTSVGVVDPTEHGTLPTVEMPGGNGPDRHTHRGEKEFPMVSVHHAPLSRLRPALPARRQLQAWRP